MISYIVGINSLYNFNAWSGGNSWLETFKKHPEVMVYLDNYLEYWSQERVIEGNLPLTDADVAQLAVRRSCKAKAGSSSLSIGTIHFLLV